jgi:dTDP-4-dehydrorhamnose 3,5-epimerase
MKATPLAIPEVILLEPAVYGDDRGFFSETYNKQRFSECTGVDVEFVQDNYSRSSKGVLRGIHYQIQQSQGKLVSVVSGSVYDVAVDLRRDSPTFGDWVGEELSADNRRQLWVPPGFGHAFLVLSDSADFCYKVTEYYAPEHDRCICWNDPEIGVSWPLAGEPVLSPKDVAGLSLSEAEVYP